MKRTWLLAVVAGVLALCATGCPNTAEGIKTDTKNNLDNTGDALHKAGDKVDGDGGAK